MTDTQTEPDTNITPHIDALLDLCNGLPCPQSYIVRSCLSKVRDRLHETAPHSDPEFYENAAETARLDIMRTLATATLDMHVALRNKEEQ